MPSSRTNSLGCGSSMPWVSPTPFHICSGGAGDGFQARDVKMRAGRRCRPGRTVLERSRADERERELAADVQGSRGTDAGRPMSVGPYLQQVANA